MDLNDLKMKNHPPSPGLRLFTRGEFNLKRFCVSILQQNKFYFRHRASNNIIIMIFNVNS